MSKNRGPEAPQRRHDRRATSRRVVIYRYTADGEAAVRAILSDVSQSGVGLFVESPLDAGQTFGLDLHRADGSLTRLLYTVIHCRPRGERMFQVGAELTSRQAPNAASHGQTHLTAPPVP